MATNIIQDLLNIGKAKVTPIAQNVVNNVSKPEVIQKLKKFGEVAVAKDKEVKRKAKAELENFAKTVNTSVADKIYKESNNDPYIALTKVRKAQDAVKQDPIAATLLRAAQRKSSPVSETATEVGKGVGVAGLEGLKSVFSAIQGGTDSGKRLGKSIKDKGIVEAAKSDLIPSISQLGQSTLNAATIPAQVLYNTVFGVGNRLPGKLGDFSKGLQNITDSVSKGVSDTGRSAINNIVPDSIGAENKKALEDLGAIGANVLFQKGTAKVAGSLAKGAAKRVSNPAYVETFAKSYANNPVLQKLLSAVDPTGISDGITGFAQSMKRGLETPKLQPQEVVYGTVPGGKAISKAVTAATEAEKAYRADKSKNASMPQDVLKLELPQNKTGTNTGGLPPIETPPIKQAGNAGDSSKIPTPEEVRAGLDSKIDSFIQESLGYTTKVPETKSKPLTQKLLTPITKVNELWTGGLRKVQDATTSSLENALTSKNPVARAAANTMQGFFRGAAMSPERAKAGMEFRGGLDVANQRAYDVMNSLYDLVGSDKKSLEKINAVLDPELAKNKVTFEDLTDNEKQAYTLIRGGLDLVHDISYANGNIDPDVYKKNLGTYTPRSYGIFELPEEVNKFISQGVKEMEQDIYKAKGEVDDWKKENSLNDPIYSLGKRLAQVETNRTIKNYIDFVAKNPKFLSDVERPGYTKLLDSRAYGDLAGKYVLNNIVEDMRGFFFTNEALQKAYDLFKSYDSMKIRRGQKKLLTVYNPTTHIGNIVSDNVFGFMVGVDPLTLNKNLVSLAKNKSLAKQYNDYLTRSGILGTDVVRRDFSNKLNSIEELAKQKNSKPSLLEGVKNVGKNIDKGITGLYGGTDDAYKMAAFKALIDQGKSLEEATRLVADGFQNYSNVGKFYDVYAKTPLLGSAFVKFQGDLLRMIKNAAVNRPLQLAGFLGALKVTGDVLSQASGENPEDKKVRESRLGAPVIPGLNIPLAWQTPIGEVNVARYIVPFYMSNAEANDGVRSTVSRFLPGGGVVDYLSNLNNTRDRQAAVSGLFQDPLLAPLAQVAIADRDFRGKPIADPNETRYKPSTASDSEKISNQLAFLLRSYTPPVANSVVDATNNLQGKEDYYGRTRDPMQTIARLAGVKIEEFGSDQAKIEREKQASRLESADEAIKKNIESINSSALKGEITPEQRVERIQQYAQDATFDVNTYAEENMAKKFNKKPEKPKSASDIAAQKKRELKAKVMNEQEKKAMNTMIEAIKVKYSDLSEDEIVKTIRAKQPTFSEDAIRYAISEARR